MLSRINDVIHYKAIRLVTRFGELPYSVQMMLVVVSLVVFVALRRHFGMLSKGNPGGHIPIGWRHSF
jgi:hypothetical protein